jgi:ferritin
MVSDELRLMLNTQYNFEIYSSLLYEQLATFSYEIGLDGLASYFEKAACEERDHSYDFRNFLLAINETPYIITEETSIDVMNIKSSMYGLLSSALDHEKFITENIENLLTFAKEQQNYQVETLALDFIKEQIEEEDKLQRILDRLDNNITEIEIDEELGEED